MTRWSAPLVAAAVVASTLWWAPSAAAAACSGTSGVTVVVDYQGSVGVGCAPGDPSSGLAALRGAGHGYDFVPRQPGLVCRIDSRPATCSAETTAYWSYWHAAPGGSWVYSTLGAGSRDPRPGTVEGWAFGAGTPPSVAPPAPRPAPKPPAPTPAPKPAPQPSAEPPPPPGAPPTVRATPTTSGPTTTRTSAEAATNPTSTSPASTPPTGTSSTSAVPTGTDPTTPTSAEIAPSAGQQDDSGTPVTFLLGLGLVVLLGALGIGTARRRAKAGS